MKLGIDLESIHPCVMTRTGAQPLVTDGSMVNEALQGHEMYCL